jgi:hypothetical protein
MKKATIFVFFVLFFSVFISNAQSAATSAPATPFDTSVYSDYVGKYKFKEAPFEEIIVTIKDGKLFGEAVGQGSAELAPMKETSKENEIFEIVGYGGTNIFKRDVATLKVVKVILNIQGSTLEGDKVE